MHKPKKVSVSRRGFLKGSAAGAAALVTSTGAEAQRGSGRGGRGAAPVPTEAQLAIDTGGVTPAQPSAIVEHPASDFMVDVIKALGIEYVAANPGSSFDSIQESIINYGGNSKPEF